MNISKQIMGTRVFDLGLPSKTLKVLQKSNIKNLHDLFVYKLEKLKGINNDSKHELKVFLNHVKQTYSPNRISNELLFTLDGKQKPYQYINELCEFIFSFQNDSRIIKIIQLRFGLKGNKQHSFTEIGKLYNLTNVRISQILQSSLEIVSKVVNNNSLFYTIKIHDKIINEVEKLYTKIKESGNTLIESEIIRVVENNCNVKFDIKYLNELHFFVFLCGFEKIPAYLFGQTAKTYNTWILSDSINKYLLLRSVNNISTILRNKIIPVHVTELKRLLKKEAIDTEYIQDSLKICSDIEKIEKDTYQYKFEYLHSIADKAYRALYNKKIPIHVKKILKEINNLLLISGSNENVKLYSLHNILIHDNRFSVVGGTGNYFLKEFNNISKAAIAELIEEYFIMNKKGSSFQPIFEYVKSKRPNAKRKSVISIVKQDKRFIKSGKNIYELKLWGGTEIKNVKMYEIQEKIISYLKTSSKTEFTLSNLKIEIENELPLPFSYSKFYYSIYRIPNIKIIKQKNSHVRKIAYCKNL
ncbi:MAG: hypothetical protein GY936_10995 [Ignavibacteriae bacterium]|nr:hypothetical protein [Ignavibacteriota bacterium]